MYLQDVLGFDVSAHLKQERIDAFLGSNVIRVQSWETAAVEASGLHLTLVRYILALLAATLAGLLHRFVPSTAGRHIYAIVTGAVLLYYPFGNQVALVLIPSFVIRLVMRVAPKHAGKLSWVISFPFMLLCMERSGKLWDTGAIDIIGSLMVLTLKQVAVCHNLSDGRSKRSEKFSEERRSLLIKSPPSALAFWSYMFATGNLLAGPFFEFSEYDAFMRRTEPFAEAVDNRLLGPAVAAAVGNLAVGCVTVAIRILVDTYLPFRMLTAPGVWELSLLSRYAVVFAVAIRTRCQYYFVWAFSEAGINLAGFGFNGYADQEKKRAKFDRYSNAILTEVESCNSMALIARCWNINTGKWLRRYVYERAGGGLGGMTLTQMVSGVWHGLRDGYMAFFIMTIPMFHTSKIVFKQEKRLPPGIVNSTAWWWVKWVISHMELNVFSLPFSLLELPEFWPAWQALYFIPHYFVLVKGLIGFLPTPRVKSNIGSDKKVD